MSGLFSEKQLHKVGRIDRVVGDYFENNPSVTEVAAKDLMTTFIENSIFFKDSARRGSPIRILLRQLDAAEKLHLFKHCKVVRKEVSRNWYFVR
jgi:hypothetical protein